MSDSDDYAILIRRLIDKGPATQDELHADTGLSRHRLNELLLALRMKRRVSVAQVKPRGKGKKVAQYTITEKTAS